MHGVSALNVPIDRRYGKAAMCRVLDVCSGDTLASTAAIKRHDFVLAMASHGACILFSFAVTQRMLATRHGAQRMWQSVQVLIVARLAEVLTRPLGGTRGSQAHVSKKAAKLIHGQITCEHDRRHAHIGASIGSIGRVTLQLRCVAGPLPLGFRAGPADLDCP
jgi:hypothetical protein